MDGSNDKGKTINTFEFRFLLNPDNTMPKDFVKNAITYINYKNMIKKHQNTKSNTDAIKEPTFLIENNLNSPKKDVCVSQKIKCLESYDNKENQNSVNKQGNSYQNNYKNEDENNYKNENENNYKNEDKNNYSVVDENNYKNEDENNYSVVNENNRIFHYEDKQIENHKIKKLNTEDEKFIDTGYCKIHIKIENYGIAKTKKEDPLKYEDSEVCFIIKDLKKGFSDKK